MKKKNCQRLSHQKAATQKRIAELQALIKYHQQNIARLFAFACGNDLKNKRYPLAVQNHQRTADDDACFLFTIANLRAQIAHAQQELQNLREEVA